MLLKTMEPPDVKFMVPEFVITEGLPLVMIEPLEDTLMVPELVMFDVVESWPLLLLMVPVFVIGRLVVNDELLPVMLIIPELLMVGLPA